MGLRNPWLPRGSLGYPHLAVQARQRQLPAAQQRPLPSPFWPPGLWYTWTAVRFGTLQAAWHAGVWVVIPCAMEGRNCPTFRLWHVNAISSLNLCRQRQHDRMLLVRVAHPTLRRTTTSHALILCALHTICAFDHLHVWGTLAPVPSGCASAARAVRCRAIRRTGQPQPVAAALAGGCARQQGARVRAAKGRHHPPAPPTADSCFSGFIGGRARRTEHPGHGD